MNNSPCILCKKIDVSTCYQPPTIFNGKRFNYLKCKSCKTIFLSPLPSQHDLNKMYNDDLYHQQHYIDESVVMERANVSLARLKQFKSGGRLLDVGCGSGVYLKNAAHQGFEAHGLEYDEKLVLRLTGQGLRVMMWNKLDRASMDASFDVVHIGDVLEHVGDPLSFMNDILSFLKPGGFFVLEGPLENNASLSLTLLKSYKWMQKAFRKNLQSDHIPYHLSMMTYLGATSFMKRFPLKIREDSLSEEDWPIKMDFSNKNPRSLVKSTIAWLSMKSSHSWVGKQFKWGNRIQLIAEKI